MWWTDSARPELTCKSRTSGVCTFAIRHLPSSGFAAHTCRSDGVCLRENRRTPSLRPCPSTNREAE